MADRDPKRSNARTGPCPVCGGAVASKAENAAFPFCSDRCRTIDLGRWLDERYRIPLAEEPPDDDAADGLDH